MEIAVLDSPAANPGKCYYCGGVDKECYLDTGIQIEFYGALYICNECFVSIANKMGYISPIQFLHIQEKNVSLEQEKDALEFKFMALEQALNSLKAAGFNEPDSDSSDDTLLIHPSTISSESPLPFEQFSEGEGTVEPEGTESPESSDEQGLGDLLSSHNSNDEPFSFKY